LNEFVVLNVLTFEFFLACLIASFALNALNDLALNVLAFLAYLTTLGIGKVLNHHFFKW